MQVFIICPSFYTVNNFLVAWPIILASSAVIFSDCRTRGYRAVWRRGLQLRFKNAAAALEKSIKKKKKASYLDWGSYSGGVILKAKWPAMFTMLGRMYKLPV